MARHSTSDSLISSKIKQYWCRNVLLYINIFFFTISTHCSYVHTYVWENFCTYVCELLSFPKSACVFNHCGLSQMWKWVFLNTYWSVLKQFLIIIHVLLIKFCLLPDLVHNCFQPFETGPLKVSSVDIAGLNFVLFNHCKY